MITLPHDGGTDGPSEEEQIEANKTAFIAENKHYHIASYCDDWASTPFSSYITDPLFTGLSDDGIMTARFDDEDSPPAVPSQWVESTYPAWSPSGSGTDNIHADSSSYVFYAGHGAHNNLFFTQNELGECRADFRDSIRLGVGNLNAPNGGGRANFFTAWASCVGFTDGPINASYWEEYGMPAPASVILEVKANFEQTVGKSELRMVFAFHDSPSIGNPQRPRQWWDDQVENKNGSIASIPLWREAMPYNIDPSGFPNMPVVYVTGSENADEYDDIEEQGNIAYPFDDIGPTSSTSILPKLYQYEWWKQYEWFDELGVDDDVQGGFECVLH